MAGPDNPPITLASLGRRLAGSIAMPIRVLISDTASAPASSTALAITVISVTLGESFTITGRSVRSLTALVTSAAMEGSVPNATPPFFTLGQEMFTSRASIPSTPVSCSANFPYSRAESPRILTMTRLLIPRRNSIFPSRNPCRPTFSSPIALSMPQAVSTTRGGGLPGRGSRDIPLTTTAPSRCRLTSWENSPA